MSSLRTAGVLAAALLFLAAPLAAQCTFGMLPPNRYAAGTNAGDIAGGDFNADSYLDLAIVNRGSGEIRILLGSPGGTFTPGVTVIGEVTWSDIMAADFNGDGKIDLAVPNPWAENFTIRPHVKTFFGNGDGTFRTIPYRSEMIVYQNPGRLAEGDFDNDGRMEAVVTKESPPAVSLLTQSWNGGFLVERASFSTLEGTETSGFAHDVTTGDFDGDQNLDFAVITTTRIMPFYGAGNGMFSKGTSIPLVMTSPSQGPSTLASGDLDGNGRDDLVIAVRDDGATTNYPPLLVALSSSSSRSFLPVTTAALPQASYPATPIVADMDGDGKQDVVFGHFYGVQVYRGNGDGTLAPKLTLPYTESLGLMVADVDRDGAPDVLSTAFSAGQLIIVLNGCAQAALRLTSTANPAAQGAPFTLTAALTTPSGAVPTGTLKIMRGATTIASGSLTAGMSVSATVELLESGTYEYTASYSGDSRFAAGTAKLKQVVEVPPFGPPPRLNAVNVGGAVQLSWFSTSGTAHYEIWRNAGAGYIHVGVSPVAGFSDASAPAATTLLYRVRGVSSSGSVSDFSRPDLATTRVFADDPLQSRVTVVKVAHRNELRAAIDAARFLAGLAPATFSSSTAVMANDIVELRDAVNAARTAIGLAAARFTDSAMSPRVTPIRAIHFMELRDALR